MAKELPFYKHEPSEWLEGEIQVCSDAAIVCFTNLRDGYWLKLGCMSYAFALQKYCRRDASIMQELIDNGIIDKVGDDIRIKFLDKQLEEFKSVSEKRRQAAEKRWNDASAMQMHSKSNAIREDKIREDKSRKEIIPNGICQNENFDKAHKGEKIDFTLLLEFYNKTFGKQARIVNDKVKRAYNARMKQGYLKEDIQKAMQVCKLNDFHKSNNFQYCTLEFFSRSDTLDKYATVGDKSQKPVYSPR